MRPTIVIHARTKVRKFGNSLGVVLPKEVINRLHSGNGEPLFLIEAPDGGYRLTPYDPALRKRGAGRQHHEPLPQYAACPREVKPPVWIDARDALALHGRLLTLHGGATGLRDDALLKSALARPQQHLAYADSPDIADLVRNHPFVDGNKRTGFVVGILFVELNGYRFTASEENAAKAVLELAGGNLDEAGYSVFIRANTRRSKRRR